MGKEGSRQWVGLHLQLNIDRLPKHFYNCFSFFRLVYTLVRSSLSLSPVERGTDGWDCGLGASAYLVSSRTRFAASWTPPSHGSVDLETNVLNKEMSAWTCT